MSVGAAHWSWGPVLLREFNRRGVPWKVVDRPLTAEELGTSPGDVYWDGRTLHIERDCPMGFVAHELAHFIVTKKDFPAGLSRRNWGTEGVQTRDLESEACDVSVALLVKLRLPWHALALELNMPETHLETDWRDLPPTEKGWAIIKAQALKASQPYLEEE